MNFQEADILQALRKKPYSTQYTLAEETGHSIGVVNRSIKQLKLDGYINDRMQLTRLAHDTFEKFAPRNAIILAAGFGMRMVPINLTAPKALLEVNGERLIERLIKQLKAVGIEDITVVVGFMKESFEYLIDEYGVDLVVNFEYASYNNLHSLALVSDRIHNTYIVPCDIWLEHNPFNTHELYSWYMVSDIVDEDSSVRVNRKKELVAISKETAGNAMIGVAYLQEREADVVRERLKKTDDAFHKESFWEETLYRKDRMIVQAKVARSTEAVEINTYEQLREVDAHSNQLRSDAIQIISEVLDCADDEIVDISVLKKGMTNRSFLFSVCGKKYLMRIPGEGTEKLINRKQEAAVIHAISGRGLCDDPIYINPENGYKITRYLEGIRCCDPEDPDDLQRCMEKLKAFHNMKITVSHTFDIFGQINFYESLWEGDPSVYRDYSQTKENVFSLRDFIDSLNTERCLTHIDAVPDNFLFYTLPDGTEGLQLTDWEYAGMQDPHVDIAMFCIYSLYDKARCDRLIDMYFDRSCDNMTRAKIYAYIASCGLLWSNWCEYKRKLGVEFGEYSLWQYRYAKQFYKLAKELIEKTS